jgi:hypothetical protein
VDARPLILAILREARSSGVAPILRTTLVKYLYLLDVYTAQETQGTPVSHLEWRFLHFGPFSVAAAQALDELTAHGAIFADQRQSSTEEKEFVLYDLPERPSVPDLRELGISRSSRLRIQADMKRYGKDLPRLLDYVYFRTAPMAHAKPGEVLDFSGCIELRPEDVRPVEMRRLHPKAIEQTRKELRKLIQTRKSAERIPKGVYDEAYFSALSSLDGDPVVTELKGKAELKV